MTDIRLKEHLSLEVCTMDFLLTDLGMLDESEELATAARVALGTDALAGATDILPDPDSTDRKGWWGDLDAAEIWGGWPIGCLSWLLTRAKITPSAASEGSTLQRAQNYTADALQPFIDKRIATQTDVVATRTKIDQIEVNAQIFRGPAAEIDLRYQLLWTQEPAIEDALIPAPKAGNHRIRIPYRSLHFTSTAPKPLPIRLFPAVCRVSLVNTAPSVNRTIVRHLTLKGFVPKLTLNISPATAQAQLHGYIVTRTWFLHLP